MVILPYLVALTFIDNGLSKAGFYRSINVIDVINFSPYNHTKKPGMHL